MATRIGCDNLVYALMTTEDTKDAAPTYGTIKSAPGVMSVNINPNPSQETLFADDGPMETATTLGNIAVEIQKNALTTQNKADLLGHQIDTKGALVYGASDVPPYVAVGFRSLKSNGKYRYVWLYKGKFVDPEDQNETKGDSINFQADTITGQFLKLDFSYTVNSKTIYPWKYELDEDHTVVNQATIDAWFTEIPFPWGSTDPASALTATFAAGTADGTTKATITGAAGSGNYFAYKISDEQFPETVEDGLRIYDPVPYESEDDIPGVDAVTMKYIALYELTSTNAAIKYLRHTLTGGQINSI